MARRRIFKIAIWTGSAALAVVLALGGLYWVGISRFNPDPPARDYSKPQSALQAQQQDIDYFRKLMAMDRAFLPNARAEANRRLDGLAVLTAAMDRDHLRVVLMQIAALADNGHTSLYSNKNPNGRSRLLPIRVRDFSDGYYVMRVEPGNADLLGARVVAIEGKPIADVVARLEALHGGTAGTRAVEAGLYLTSSGLLYGLGIAPSPDRGTWTFETREHRTVERTFAAYQPTIDEPYPDLWRWEVPQPIKGDRHWVAFDPGISLPVTDRDPDTTFRNVPLAGTCISLVQLKSNADQSGEKIARFLKATQAGLESRKPCAIIFDLRHDGGGDYTNTASFAAALPRIVGPQGHVYILTGPNTFSAGITTVVFTKQVAPARVTILGEPVGDNMSFWAEGNFGCLPNAPFCFHYATGKHDYRHACTDPNDCFWLNWIYPAHTDSMSPDQIITESFADYLAGRDPVFDRALALAKSKNNS